MHILTYQIAEHYFRLEVDDISLIPELMPSYKAFEVVQGVADSECLFTLRLGAAIDKPEGKSYQSLYWEGIHCRVYESEYALLASLGRHADRPRCYLRANKEMTVWDCDLPLRSLDEAYYLRSFIITAYGLSSAYRGTLKLHASCIELKGEALLFLGESGTGKSTHSRLWLKYIPGATLLNDDEPILRLFEDGSVRVYGAPWSGSTDCYRQVSAELKGIVRLYQAPENRLRRLGGMDAFAAMTISTASFPLDKRHFALVQSLIFELLERIPVYGLECRPDREALSLTETLLTPTQ